MPRPPPAVDTAMDSACETATMSLGSERQACSTPRGLANGNDPLAPPALANGSAPKLQWQFNELLQALSQECGNLQRLHEATAEKNAALTKILRSGLPFTDAEVAEACENGAGAGQCSEETDQEVEVVLELAVQDKCMADAGLADPTPYISSGTPGEQSGHQWLEPISEDQVFTSQGSPITPGARHSANLRAGFAAKSKASGSTNSLGNKLTGKLKRLGQKFAHPGAAAYSSEGSETPGGATSWMKSMYKNVWFEPALASVIMLNAVAMIFELQYQGIQLGYELQFKGSTRSASDAWPKAEQVFDVLEWLFGLIFALEMLFRMKVLKMEFFKDAWNWIDVVIVGCFVIERLFFLPIGTQWIRICRLMRLGRLLTLARTVEGFDHLFLITTAIKGSVGILAWALLLLFVIHMTIALVVGKFLHAAYFDNVDASVATDTQQKIYEYFGTWTRAMLSMFEITLANWPPICRLLTEEVSEWFAVVCLVHKLTVGFAVVGVINGVFMKETFRVAETDDIIMVRQKTRCANLHRKNMQHLFDALDSSGDGRVSKREFRNLAEFPTVKMWLGSMDLCTDDLDTMFQLIDINGDGGISFEELMIGVAKLQGSARSIDLLTFHRDHKAHVEDHFKTDSVMPPSH